MASAVSDPLRPLNKTLVPVVEKLLSGFFGRVHKIRRFRKRRSNYSSSYAIENLEIELEDGRRMKLVLKDLSPRSLLTTARDVRPGFLFDPRREIVTYRSLLQPGKFGTATCYGAVEQVSEERYWLFLERVEGVLLWQVGRLEQWERAARWLARFHNEFASAARRGVVPSVLLRYDSAHYMRWMERALQHIGNPARGVAGESAKQFDLLAKRYGEVVERFSSLGSTVIHGEFYPSNVLLRGGARGTRICPIDWEVAAVGPGIFDLAALASGAWNEEQKEKLVKSYQEELHKVGGEVPSREELKRLVDYAQLHLAVQWLGWAADWSPPKSHERDWLREALRLAARLGVI